MPKNSPALLPANTFSYHIKFTGSATTWGNGMHGFHFDEWGTSQGFHDDHPQLAIISHVILDDHGADYGLLAARLVSADFIVGHVEYNDNDNDNDDVFEDDDEDQQAIEKIISNFDQSFEFELFITSDRELDEDEIEEMLGEFVEQIHINADYVAETVEFTATPLDKSQTVVTPDLPKGSDDTWAATEHPRARVTLSGKATAPAGEKLDAFEFKTWPTSGPVDLTDDLCYINNEISRYCLTDDELREKAKANGVGFIDARGVLATFDVKAQPDGSATFDFHWEIDFLTRKPLKPQGADWLARLARDIAMPEEWVDPSSWTVQLSRHQPPPPAERERLRREVEALKHCGYLIKNRINRLPNI